MFDQVGEELLAYAWPQDCLRPAQTAVAQREPQPVLGSGAH